MTHTAIKRGRASRRSVDPRFKWVNTCLADIKGAITGTCRAIRRRHAGRYLAAYEYRFNRRFDLPDMVPALAKPAAATAPKIMQPCAQRKHSGNQVLKCGRSPSRSQNVREADPDVCFCVIR